jgi:hypothetical protein
MRLRLLALILAAGALSVGVATSASAADTAPSSDRAVATESVLLVDRDGRMPISPYGRYWS